MGNFLSGGQEKGYEDIQRALEQAQAQQRQYYQEAVGRLQPYMGAGVRGLGAYERGLAPLASPQEFYRQMISGYQTSPAVQQELQQAEQAAQYGGLATGLYGSGQQRKALADVAQQLTARDINDYFNRMSGIYGQYLGGQQRLAQAGQLAGTQAGQWGVLTGRDIAELQQQIGQAQYAQEVAKQRGLGSLIGTIGGSILDPGKWGQQPTTLPSSAAGGIPEWGQQYMPTTTPSWAAPYLAGG